MQILRQSTEIKVRIGPFVDVGDGFTPQTDIGNPDTNLTGVDEAELLKNNGAATVDITSNTWAAISGCDGWYDLTLSASNTDTVGLLTIVVQDDSDCLPVFCHFQVIEETVFDEIFKSAATGINSACDTALSDINLDHFIQTTSTVSDASATTAGFDTALAEASDDHYNNMVIVFTDNNLAGQARRISDYDGTDKTITVVPAFTEAPANGDAFVIISGSYFRIPAAGALEITYTVKEDDEDTGDPIDGVEVWITTDEAGNNVIWSGSTDASGILKEAGDSKPFLDAGTYYFWRRKSGYSFTNPDSETFS